MLKQCSRLHSLAPLRCRTPMSHLVNFHYLLLSSTIITDTMYLSSAGMNCMFGTHSSRRRSISNASDCGSSIRRPYSDIIKCWLCCVSNNCNLKSANNKSNEQSIKWYLFMQDTRGLFTRNVFVYGFLWSLASRSWKCKHKVWTPSLLAVQPHSWCLTQKQMQTLRVNKASKLEEKWLLYWIGFWTRLQMLDTSFR